MVSSKHGKGTSALPVKYWSMVRAYFAEYIQRYQFMAPGIYYSGKEADILCVRLSGYVDEIEIKTSRSDFLADFKKWMHVKNPAFDDSVPPIHNMRNRVEKWVDIPKHEALAKGLVLPNYFSFLMPADLADQCKDDIPKHSGLYAYHQELTFGRIETIKRAKILHRDKIGRSEQWRLLEKVSARYRYQIINDPNIREDILI